MERFTTPELVEHFKSRLSELNKNPDSEEDIAQLAKIAEVLATLNWIYKEAVRKREEALANQNFREPMPLEELIAAIESELPLVAPRCAGKRFTYSVLYHLTRLAQLTEDLKGADNGVARGNPNT